MLYTDLWPNTQNYALIHKTRETCHASKEFPQSNTSDLENFCNLHVTMATFFVFSKCKLTLRLKYKLCISLVHIFFLIYGIRMAFYFKWLPFILKNKLTKVKAQSWD